MANVIDVDELIDRQPLRPRSVLVLGLLLVALLCDGFDLQVLSFAAPGLVRDWGISRPALGPIFSANLVGMMLGAFFLGWVGERYGRKKVIVAGTFFYAAACLACLAAGSLWELGLLRFLTGIGLGGVLPNVIALTAEMTPRRHRAMLTSLVVIGMSLGSSMPGIVARTLVPEHGWQALFLVGGLAPMAIGVLLAFALPESLGFLAARGVKRAQIERRARSIDPLLQITPTTHFVVHDHQQTTEPGMGKLFRGPLRVTTPALWVMFAGTLLSMFMMTSWMPLLFEDAGLPPTQSSDINSLYHLGGTVAAIATALLLGRIGVPWILVLLVVAVLSVTAVALTGFAPGVLAMTIFAAGFGIVGCQTALNASAGLIYPSGFRPTGVGAALAVGRIGSIIGPLVGGYFIGTGLTTQHIFFVPLIPLGLAIVATILLIVRRVDIRTGAGGLAAH